MTADIKDFFLASPMADPEFMRILLKHIPEDIIIQYNLRAMVDENGYVYIKIAKGMYGLKQAAILAYTKFISIFKPFGYHPIPHTVGMWQHKTRKTNFCLCVDDFGIKYTLLYDAQHLLNALTSAYTISTDCTGKYYCGLTFDWDYIGRTVDSSIPNNIHKVLHKYQHPPPDKSMYAPHTYNEPVYGKRRQMAPDLDESSYLSTKGIKEIQGIICSLL